MSLESLHEHGMLETTSCRYGTMTFFAQDQIIGKSLREYGEWAQAEIDLLLEQVNPGDTVIDIGAFIGTHTLAFASKVTGDGRVLSFEPVPLFHELLLLNLSQNRLTQVDSFQAGLSNKRARVRCSLPDPHDNKNPGNLSLSGRQSISPAIRNTFSVKLDRLDRYWTGPCALIKIDAEGMEPHILKGASHLLREARPFVYAECNSLEHGWPSLKQMKDMGYRAFLHVPLSYNPGNFRESEIDFLPGAREAALAFVPQERTEAFRETCSSFFELIPIETLDDLALGMLKKPQYKHEVLQKTSTFAVIGNSFWANEPELAERASSMKAKLTAAQEHRDFLLKEIAENEGNFRAELASLRKDRELLSEKLAAMDGERAEIEKRTADLFAVHSEERARLITELNSTRAKVLELEGEVDERQVEVENQRRTITELEQTSQAVRQDLDRILHSRSWRYTYPLRSAMEALRGARRDAVPRRAVQGVGAPRLFFSCDSLVLRNDQVYGWGWLFHSDVFVRSVELELSTDQWSETITCQYGIRRPDVARDYPEAISSGSSGFLVSGRLTKATRDEDKVRARLHVLLGDGRTSVLDLTVLEQKATGFERTEVTRGRAGAAGMIRKARAVVRYLSRGDLRGLFSRVTATRPKGRFDFGRLVDPDAFRSSLRAAQRLQVILDHDLGGGANYYCDSLSEKLLRDDRAVLLVYFDLPSLELHGTLRWRQDRIRTRIGSTGELFSLLGDAEPESILVNTLYSWPEPLEALGQLVDLMEDSAAKLVIPFHDYFPVCPSYTLLDHDGQFCGVPSDLTVCDACLARHIGAWTGLVSQRDIREWRAVWGKTLQMSDELKFFSRSSWEIVRRAHPDIPSEKITIEPHKVDHISPDRMDVDFSTGLHIGVVGHITAHKGSGVVRGIVQLIEDRGVNAKVTVIGEIEDPPRAKCFRQTGGYRRNDLPYLVRRSRANIFLVSSIWPETFSYVTEELIKLGLPVAAFDIGAPAERLKSYPKSLLIDKIDPTDALQALIDWYSSLASTAGTS
jgi:FkbM family methyltransferase